MQVQSSPMAPAAFRSPVQARHLSGHLPTPVQARHLSGHLPAPVPVQQPATADVGDAGEASEDDGGDDGSGATIRLATINLCLSKGPVGKSMVHPYVVSTVLTTPAQTSGRRVPMQPWCHDLS